VGGNAFTAHDLPNSSADVIPGCPGTPATLPPELVCTRNRASTAVWAAARSKHTGGVNVVMADGAVRFVSNGISLATWRALATRAGRETVSDDY